MNTSVPSPDDEDPASTPASDDATGSVESLPDEGSDVTDTDDGGAIVKLEDAPPTAKAANFYENLVETISVSTLATLGSTLIDSIEQDLKSRENRDEQYAEGIRRTGLGNEAPGGAKFDGASRVVHPVLTKACIDFEARAIAELMPASGPVKDSIVGKSTQARVDKAQRKTAHMNWQLRRQMTEFRPELEQLLSQCPLGGSQFMYLPYDAKRRRPTATYWPSDDVIIPFAASSAASAERLTMRERITERVYKSRVDSSYYVEGGNASALTPEQSKAQDASDAVEGKELDPYNQDGLRPIYRVFTECELDDDPETKGEFAPYTIEVDPTNSKIIRIVRNWEQPDKQRTSMPWLIEFPFLPWRGALSIGLAHAIGGLAGAATGAIRALLDSAHFQNLPGLVKIKGANFSGQTHSVDIGQVLEVEGGALGVNDDIRKLLMAIPYNQPSPVLMTLLGVLTDQAESFVQTTLKNLTDDNINQLPVGTALSAIEEGLKVLSGIHLRLHEAMTRLLEVLHRINRLYLDEEELKDEAGEILAYRSDYTGPIDVAPVSDPNIFSDAQRFAQTQVVAGRAQLLPQIYDLRKVETLILKRTRIPDAESLLLPENKPTPMNQVNENVAMSLGRPVAAFPQQDHLAHLQVLIDFMESPFLGQLPTIAPKFMPAAIQHATEHIVMWYADAAYQMVNAETKQLGHEFSDLMNPKEHEQSAEVDKTLAMASPMLVENAGKMFSKIPPIIQRAQQLIAQLQPNFPQDPAIAANLQAVQIKTASDEKRDAAKMQGTLQSKQMDLAAKGADTQARAADSHQRSADKQQDNLTKLRIVAQQTDADLQREREVQAATDRRNAQDNQTALTISEAEILAGNRSNMTTGTGINP